MPKFGKCCLLQCLQIQTEESITKLDFSNTPLSDNFPQIWEHERTLEDLCLNSSRLSSLPPQLFYCQSLRVLSVSNNNLEEIPNAIGTLRQLQMLNISRNFISSLPDNLKSCKNITYLDLSCNNLQRLPEAISYLVSLQELFLNETYLEFLPANFGRLKNLRILELRLNSLLTLPKSMSRLINLERLDIGGNEFKELPEVIGDLNNLRELWIDFNQIRRIPESIRNLEQLQHFEANGNLIDNIPNEVNTWQKVEVFSICSNNLQCLPNTFGSLKSLVTLRCEFCEISELPDSISCLEQLEELVVSHNKLVCFPATIGMLRNLRSLFADDNDLRSLPDALCCCISLTVLSVSRNKLYDLPSNIGHLTDLKVLNLVENYISTLPVSILNMSKLSSLWLSDNQTQPLVPLHYSDIHDKTRLTCILLPQRRELENIVRESKSINIASHQSPLRKLCFANETHATFKEEGTTAEDSYNNAKGGTLTEEQLEPRLMRSPTPYPKELRIMSKYIRSTQKMLKESDSPNVKEARIVANKCVPTINDNDRIVNANFQENDTFLTEAGSFHFQPLISPINENVYDQEVKYPTLHHYESNSLPSEQYEAQTCNSYSTFHNTGDKPMVETTLNGSQTELRYHTQPQLFMTPPPYHIARNYTKKTLKDLSTYDSMRNQKYILENNTSANLSKRSETESPNNVSGNQENTAHFSNFDGQNNVLDEGDIKSVAESIVKKKTWIFGAHKNPMVKQVTFKREDDFPSFSIGRLSNQDGIYIISIIPNSTASRLLSVNDKLLEVNGYDFTNISLEEAKQKLQHTGNLVNVMLSRK